MKIKEQKYWINILNNEYWVRIYVGEDVKYLEKVLLKHFEERLYITEDDLKNIRGRCFHRVGFAPFIWINMSQCKTLNLLYATLAHEGCHAVDYIFNKIGDNNRDELFAHSVGAIVRSYKL